MRRIGFWYYVHRKLSYIPISLSISYNWSSLVFKWQKPRTKLNFSFSPKLVQFGSPIYEFKCPPLSITLGGQLRILWLEDVNTYCESSLVYYCSDIL